MSLLLPYLMWAGYSLAIASVSIGLGQIAGMALDRFSGGVE